MTHYIRLNHELSAVVNILTITGAWDKAVRNPSILRQNITYWTHFGPLD